MWWLKLLSVLVDTAAVVMLLILSPYLVFLYDDPNCGNKPLLIVIPYFMVTFVLALLDFYLVRNLINVSRKGKFF
jgi:hypothetical protein